MKLENQVTSLELSKRLKELGVKQNGYFFWRNDYPNNPSRYPDIWYLIPETDWPYTFEKRAVEYEAGLHLVSAFTVAELGEMLPKGLPGQNGYPGTALHIGRTYEGRWFCGYSWLDDRTLPASHDWDWCEKSENEAEARGLMLEYLITNNLLETL